MGFSLFFLSSKGDSKYDQQKFFAFQVQEFFLLNLSVKSLHFSFQGLHKLKKKYCQANNEVSEHSLKWRYRPAHQKVDKRKLRCTTELLMTKHHIFRHSLQQEPMVRYNMRFQEFYSFRPISFIFLSRFPIQYLIQNLSILNLGFLY